MTGDVHPPQDPRDFTHLGFALENRDAVDVLAERGRLSQNLSWPKRDESNPFGDYCALKDPDGNLVKFSYGQPLGPGVAEPRHGDEIKHSRSDESSDTSG